MDKYSSKIQGSSNAQPSEGTTITTSFVPPPRPAIRQEQQQQSSRYNNECEYDVEENPKMYYTRSEFYEGPHQNPYNSEHSQPFIARSAPAHHHPPQRTTSVKRVGDSASQGSGGSGLKERLTRLTSSLPGLVKSKDYLLFSLFNLFCCCSLIAIPALIYSIMAREKKREGNDQSFQRYSKCALRFNIVAIIIGVILFIVSIIFLIVSSRNGGLFGGYDDYYNRRNYPNQYPPYNPYKK